MIFKKHITHIKVTLVALMCVAVSKAQDIHFSQFFAMPILVNPANAGVEYDLDIGIIHRNQWKAVAQPFTSYGASISGKVPTNSKKKRKGRLGLGLDMYYDKSGDASFVSMQSGLNVAYNLQLNKKSFFSTGFKVNFNQRSINNTNFQWGEQYFGKGYNSSLPTGEQLSALQRVSFVDVAAGFNYRFKSGEKNMSSNTARIFDIGVSGFHINKSDVALYRDGSTPIGTRVMLYLQGVVGVNNTNLSILPKAYWQIQGKHQELVLGALVSIKPKNDSKVTGFVNSNIFNIGLLYRGKDAVIGVVQYEIKKYVIGLSYDVNVSKLTSTSSGKGAYEISLRYNNLSQFLRKNHSKKYGANKFL